MGWATIDDLLVGDIAIDHIDVDPFIDGAENEINVHLGQFYVLPVSASGYSLTLLNLIQGRLASGRLIMAQSAGDQDILNYGKSLVDFAYERLYTIGASIDITGATPISANGSSRVPGVVDPNAGQPSPFKVYENYVHGDDPCPPGITWLAT